jgi:hypothetical protein
MNLIDYCLENKVKNNKKILTEEELRNEYCPGRFIDNISAFKKRKGGDSQDCIYNDSTQDYSEYCNKCWNREIPRIKKN